MARFMAIGDLHLNERGGLGPERLKDQEDVWRAALNVAREEDVGAVLFVGDAFEHRRPTPAEMMAFQRPLEKFYVEGRPRVTAIPGNHDVAHPDEPIGLDVFAGDGALQLHRLPDAWQIDAVEKIHIAALPWTPVSRLVAEAGGGDRDDLNVMAAEYLVSIARGLRDRCDGPAILLAHWSVTGAATPDGLGSEHFREPVLDRFDLFDQGWDAVVLGHIHKPQDVGLRGDDDSPPFFYVGSPLPLNHGEAACEHGCWILEGPPFEARFVPLESRRFVTLSMGTGDAYALVGGDILRSATDFRDAIVRVRYTADEQQARRIDNNAIRQALLEAGAWRVTVEPTIVREQRARVEAMTAELSDSEAFGLWLDAQRVEERLRPVLVEAHAKYVGGAR